MFSLLCMVMLVYSDTALKGMNWNFCSRIGIKTSCALSYHTTVISIVKHSLGGQDESATSVLRKPKIKYMSFFHEGRRMAQIDAVFQRIFQEYIIYCFLIGLISWTLWTVYPFVKINLLKKQMLESELAYEIAMRYQRQELLSQLYGISSADWALRNRGVIRIVDIGVKTGINLRYYPNSSHVVAVDSKMNLENLFAPFAKTYDAIKLEKCIEFNGECLDLIPSNYADVVVATFVLCKSTEGTLLNEIYRILVPGGRYYFIEHTLDKKDRKLSNLQSLLSNSGLWPFLFEGCKLNIDMELLIRGGPFKSVEFNHIIHKFVRPFVLKYVRTHILGCAVK